MTGAVLTSLVLLRLRPHDGDFGPPMGYGKDNKDEKYHPEYFY
jgi:hypothetical protein